MRLRKTSSLVAIILGLVTISSVARAQLIDSYNPDTLTPGSSVSSLADLTGTENATAANATAANESSYAINAGGDPTAANANAAFNGHTYLNFGTGQGLATSGDLFSGGEARSIALVYDTPNGNNGQINPIAGQADGGGNMGTWFVLQSRNSPAGNPYLAGFNDDATSGSVPVANQLTFAIATYSGTTETVYWAYGLTGAVQSASHTASPALDTAANPFTIGYDDIEPSQDDMQIGQILVYNDALNGAGATAEIESLQSYYAEAVPEPATYALLLGTFAFLGLRLHRKQV